jgi:hypothetical protein
VFCGAHALRRRPWTPVGIREGFKHQLNLSGMTSMLLESSVSSYVYPFQNSGVDPLELVGYIVYQT